MPDSGNNIWFRFGRKKQKERKAEKGGGGYSACFHQNFLMNNGTAEGRIWRETLLAERIRSQCDFYLYLPPEPHSFARARRCGDDENQEKHFKKTKNRPRTSDDERRTVCDRHSKCWLASQLKPLLVLSLSFSRLAAAPPDMQS